LRLRRFHGPADVAARTVTWDLLFGGLYEQQQIAFRGLTIILLAAILLVFLLLLFLYESFRVAMLLIPLFAVAGVFLGLWVTRTEFNKFRDLPAASQRDEELAAFQVTGPDSAESPLPARRGAAPQ
jgi:fatty acid desaturase